MHWHSGSVERTNSISDTTDRIQVGSRYYPDKRAGEKLVSRIRPIAIGFTERNDWPWNPASVSQDRNDGGERECQVEPVRHSTPMTLAALGRSWLPLQGNFPGKSACTI